MACIFVNENVCINQTYINNGSICRVINYPYYDVIEKILIIYIYTNKIHTNINNKCFTKLIRT